MEILKTMVEVVNIILKKLAKLIDVKSLVTLTLTFTLMYIIVANIELNENTFNLFSNAVMLVLGFFFGKNVTDKPEE